MIELQNISKTYPSGDGELIALRDINLTFSAGGMTALMGPSGSGKSTLLNLMGSLDVPSAGKIFIDDREITALDKDDRSCFRNEKCGFIFQSFNLIPVLTVLENVMLPAQLGSNKITAELRKHAENLLLSVELQEFTNQKVNRLSGGQMQRVAIARALMNKPKIVLADEPTANLDHRTADVVLSLMKSTCRAHDATVIIATHDTSVLTHCGRTISMTDGIITSDI